MVNKLKKIFHFLKEKINELKKINKELSSRDNFSFDEMQSSINEISIKNEVVLLKHNLTSAEVIYYLIIHLKFKFQDLRKF